MSSDPAPAGSRPTAGWQSLQRPGTPGCFMAALWLLKAQPTRNVRCCRVKPLRQNSRHHCSSHGASPPCAGLRLDAVPAGRRHYSKPVGVAVAAPVPARVSINALIVGHPLRGTLAAMTCSPYCPHPTGRPLTRMDIMFRMSGAPAGVTCSRQPCAADRAAGSLSMFWADVSSMSSATA